MKNIPEIVNGTSPLVTAKDVGFTAKELYYIATHWDQVKNVVHFYENGVEVARPW